MRSSAARGGFPTIAVFSLLALSLILAAVALVGLKPWAADSLVPGLTISPGVGAALDDSTVASRPQPFGVEDARVAVAGPPAVDVAEPVAVSAPTEVEGRYPNPVLAVARARPVDGGTAIPVSSPPAAKPSPAPEPVAVAPEPTAPAPPSEPIAPPLAASPGGGTGGGSGTAVVGGPESDESCDGDEYVVTITLDAGEGTGEPSLVDILVQQLDSESGLHLEGDLDDVRELVSMLIEEGNCVRVEVKLLSEGDPTQAPAEIDPDAGELTDTVESVLP